MATFLEMKTEIGAETDRSDLRDTTIHSAVLAVIEKYEAERFWFNETREYEFTTTIDEDTYTLAPDPDLSVWEFITIDYIEVQIGNQWRRLCRVRPESMAYEKENTHPGQPLDWAQVGDKIQLYPTPNAEYTMRVAGHHSLTPLTLGEGENAWTNTAYHMIKNDAKAYFYTTIREFQFAAPFAEAAGVFYRRLQKETSRRLSTGSLKSWP